MMLGRIQALVSDTTSGVYYREGKNHQVPDFLSRYHAPQISKIIRVNQPKLTAQHRFHLNNGGLDKVLNQKI